MSDPDMGIWSYAYDTLGNLTGQTDARGCTLTMDYDDLNRLDTKTSSGNCGQQVSVDYNYDEGTNGTGRRTSMTDASGSTAWSYNERGRMVSETRTITGGGSFLTQWAYNSADLPEVMIYPGDSNGEAGEQVVYHYSDRMLLETVTGTASYVTGTEYDAAGRITSRALGNGLTQAFDYYAWDEKATVDNVLTGQGGRLKNLSAGTLLSLGYLYDGKRQYPADQRWADE